MSYSAPALSPGPRRRRSQRPRFPLLPSRDRLTLFLLATLLVSGCRNNGQLLPPRVPNQPTVMEWPDVGAVITDDVGHLHYGVVTGATGPQLIATLRHRRQIKILNRQGLNAATVRFRLDGFSAMTRVQARSVGPNGRVTTMDPYSVDTRQVVQPRMQAPEVREATFSVPNPQVGGVIDYWVERVYTAVDLVPPWVFANPMPTLRSEISISSDPGVRIEHRFARGSKSEQRQPLRRQEGKIVRLIFVEKNLPAIYQEADMPHPSRLSPWLATHVVAAEIPGQPTAERMERWSDIAKRINSMLLQVGDVRLTGGVKKRFLRVRDTITAVEVPSLGVRAPSTAQALFSGDVACTRDAAALLLNGLKDLDIEAYPAMINSPQGPPLLEDFPSLFPFVRAVVAIRPTDAGSERRGCTEDPITRGLLCSVPKDSWVFLDPLCSNCRFGELRTALTGGRAMILTPGRPRFVDVPIDPVERNRVTTRFTYALTVKGELVGSMKGEMTGEPARRLRYAAEQVTSGKQRDTLLTETIIGVGAGFQLIDAILGAQKKVDRPLRVGGDLKHMVEKLSIEQFRIMPADLVGVSWPRRWRSHRNSAAVLPAPRWVESTAELRLPIGYEVEAAEVTKIITEFGEYAAGFKRRNRNLWFSRRFIVKQQVIPADRWPDFLDFLRRVEDVETAGLLVGLKEG